MVNRGMDMDQAIFLNNAILLVGLVIAMALNLYGIKKKTFAVTAVGLTVFVTVFTYGILLGASLYESGAVCVLFLIASLTAAKE